MFPRGHVLLMLLACLAGQHAAEGLLQAEYISQKDSHAAADQFMPARASASVMPHNSSQLAQVHIQSMMPQTDRQTCKAPCLPAGLVPLVL